MSFSERMGINPPKTIQLESMDIVLKDGLWNVLCRYFFEDIKTNIWATDSPYYHIFKSIWSDHFKMHIDSIPQRGSPCIEQIKHRYFLCKWNEIYDFLEFVCELPLSNKDQIINDFNAILEKEKSGYRIVASKVTPITSEQETAEIEKAIDNSSKFNLSGVREHLENALNKLSDRQNPDYRNSIKESISAVESLVKTIAGNQSASLGDALNLIDKKIKIHPALKDGYKKIYGYTSDADGIRHALTEDSSCDLEDAQYMLISCSAFINYLIVKANKAGIIKQ